MTTLLLVTLLAARPLALLLTWALWLLFARWLVVRHGLAGLRAAGAVRMGGMVDEPVEGVEPTGYTEGGVPTFDYVRERIEGKFATSVGSTELAGETPEGVAVEEQLAERERAGRDKLEEIRRAMRGE
jgi:hypothetical protein